MLLSTDYNAKIYSGHFSDQTVKNNITSYENIEKIAPVYDDQTAICLLGYPHFERNDKFIRIAFLEITRNT